LIHFLKNNTKCFFRGADYTLKEINMDKVIIFGASQAASRAYWYLTNDSSYELAAFTVDQRFILKPELHGLPVVSFENIETIYPPDEYKMLLHINSTLPIQLGGCERLRHQKYYQAKAKGYELINYISSKATTWPGLNIGDNCRILANSVVEPFAKIGNDVIIGVGSMVSHDTVIKDHCTVIHHAVVLGNVKVEPYCFIGTNATIRSGITIARECIIGAGALILEDTVEKGVYKGNPAQLLPITSDKLKSI